jgi:dienelactone hydrolase
MLLRRSILLLVALLAGFTLAAPDDVAALGKELATFAHPPKELATDLGGLRSPLLFADGSKVKSAEEWKKRREEIRKSWHDALGAWPPLLEKPTIEFLAKEQRDNVTQHAIRIQTAPQRTTDDAFLLVPEGKGPFPAVVVVFYEAKTGVGLGKSPLRDFAWQLARRGYVTLSLGGDPNTYYPTKEKCVLQPLSFHAYEAANCHTLLASLPSVDPARIGIVGHSYGGKWALFASCLYDKFACAAWSDPGIVFDEKRSNVNYWEPWYLGFDPALPKQRTPGIPDEKNPRTGPYKRLMETGRDLHELHALMAPRPFLVSGGSEDPVERWKALNHAVAVNELLGYPDRVFMTNRPAHSPTEESNEQLYKFFDYFLKHGMALRK